MKLNYKAVNREGKTISGLIEANEIKDAANYLREHGYLPITIKEAAKSQPLDFIPFLTDKVKQKDLILFTRQISLMLVAGLPLIKSLDIVKSQSSNKALSELVGHIINDIQEGASFSKAIERHPDVFSPIYTSVVRASETSGLLDELLSRLADNLEKQQKLKDSVRAAFTYPIIVFVLMIAVLNIMMFFVVPKLTSVYVELGVDLPLPTRIVIAFSNFAISFWPIVIGVFFLLIFLFRRFYNTEEGKMLVDDLILKVPLIGNIVRKTTLVEVSRTLGILMGSGTLVVEALSLTANVASNIHFKNAIMEVSRRVEKGVSVGDTLSSYTLFPPILVQLVKVGEQTGKINETLLKASEYFENEVQQTLKTLTIAMEPFIMIVLGVAVAFLMISIIMPIYTLTSAIR